MILVRIIFFLNGIPVYCCIRYSKKHYGYTGYLYKQIVGKNEIRQFKFKNIMQILCRIWLIEIFKSICCESSFRIHSYICRLRIQSSNYNKLCYKKRVRLGTSKSNEIFFFLYFLIVTQFYFDRMGPIRFSF